MKKYEKYKNSGIAWLDEIPEHWEVRSVRNSFLFETGFTPSTEKDYYYDIDGHTWVTIADLKRKYISNSKSSISQRYLDENPKNITKKGSLLYSFKLSVGKVAFAAKDLYTNEAIFSVLPFNNYDLGYYFYSLPTQLIKNASENIYGAKMLNQKLIKEAKIVFPPKQEQTNIANFLDYKTEKINRFIKKKKQLIKLLKEQKAAIINQAVTKGLNPNVTMKDSGIEWLGEIPEHWNVKPLKYIAYSVLGKMLCNEDKGEYKKRFYLKSKNIQWLNTDISEVEEMWFSEKEMNTYRLKKGDLVISEGGEVGKTCLWENQLDECYIQNSAHKVTINNDGLSKYFLYLFFIYGKKGGFESIVNRVSIGHLTKDKLINLKCLVPKKAEQKAIVDFIKSETETIHKTISTIQKEITLVEEYKTALIAEAVTGKIDVRDFTIPKVETPLAMVAEEAANYNKS